ncbi:hypothetical protein FDH01_gp198 [Acinetobacter phage vB_AbaM_ME3]|uniref:Uncharacterized protein n=1 Tax=Acinetobacter phage vB_AbaM_ME3 TaxID=1837876 RepID=A0A172Q0P3_9CAUD|nr:hypothetical protein FDH01_gp198 [Acinetobacter phage vB_AbaM_ME3]AND75424.1 hypothetical protein ME3_263 [Acinetobacter phage vB_AbaM_ME3]
MATLYLVSVQVGDNLPLIANGREELTSKLNYFYNLTEKQIEELVVTKHLVFRMVDEESIIKTIVLQLDSTEI